MVEKEPKDLDFLDDFPDLITISVRIDDCRVSEYKVNWLNIVDLYSDWDMRVEPGEPVYKPD
jgi:hypothetical protein